MAISDARLQRMDDKIFRHTFLREMVSGSIAYQIRDLRRERGWTQAQLGVKCRDPASYIKRLENPSYGRWNIGALLKLAEAFDVALEVKFVDWPTALRGYADLGPEAMRLPSWSPSHFSKAK